MKPVSDEKRKLIVEAKKRGETQKSISLWLDVSTSKVTVI